MKALDLFCGGGGAALGLIAAGFDVVGVDRDPHPNYPGDLVVADVFDCGLDVMDFDFVWASPPCQAFSTMAGGKNRGVDGFVHSHPDLIPATRELLKGHPYTAMENLPTAPVRPDLVLTGPMFGLRKILRKRHFEISWAALQPPVSYDYVSPYEGFLVITKSLSCKTHFYPRKEMGLRGRVKPYEACEAMGIDIPMTASEVGEAIPPAYAKFVAESALRAGLAQK